MNCSRSWKTPIFGNSVLFSVATAVENEIKGVEQQVNGIIKEMEKGKSNIETRKKILNLCEAKIKGICSNLDAFIFELIEQ